MPPLIEPVVLQPLIMANDLGVDGLHRVGLERRSFELLRDHARNSSRRVVDVAQSVLDGHALLPGAKDPK